jgi:NADH-quinone oxidoreductase subunit N
MTVQSIDYAAIAPPLVVALTALLALVLDLLLPAARRASTVAIVSGIGLLVALGVVGALTVDGRRRETFCVAPGECSYAVDELTLLFQLVILAGALVVVLIAATVVPGTRVPRGEHDFLLLCSISGALVLAASRDLVGFIVALEVVTLPTFAMVGLRRYDARSSEAALKIFLVSVTATAVSLFGISLVYGATGEVFFAPLANASRPDGALDTVAAVGVVLTLAALAFKVSAVPFHFWAPDTYEGAPLPVAAYLSVVSKAAGFVGIVLLVGRAFPSYDDVWGPVVGVLAALTMTLGNLVALRQRSAIRLLAWSSIAQAGYMLVPIAVVPAASDPAAAIAATIVYVVVYAAMNLGAFAVVSVVSRQSDRNLLSDYRGLARTNPIAALALAFFLACLAGLPPGLVGLFAKVVVFDAAIDASANWLALIMAVNTVIGLAYYLAWAASLFRAGDERPAAGVPWSTGAAIGVTAAITVVLSVAPGIVLNLLADPAVLLR